jgi:TolB-like protein
MRAFSVSPGSGEIVLSRDATQISATLNAQAVIAGTFAVAGSEIWLNVRLLRAEDGAILSSVDVQVPLDYNTRPLLTALR